jgi:hypothetical protein
MMQIRNACRCVTEGNSGGKICLGEQDLDGRIILWRIDLFLGNDHETNKRTAVARQQILNKQQLHYHNRGIVEAVFSVVRSATVATQRRGKHASAATVELQQ